MSHYKVDKKAIITFIISELEHDLNQAISAANQAHALAVDDQSVAETQYDTLAIEASYLAEGQSRRVQECQTALHDYQQLRLLNFDENKPIELTALVQLASDQQAQHWFFLGPAAGGLRTKIKAQHITVITPQSPMGLALIEKYQDDDIEVMLGNNQLSDYIARIQ